MEIPSAPQKAKSENRQTKKAAKGTQRESRQTKKAASKGTKKTRPKSDGPSDSGQNAISIAQRVEKIQRLQQKEGETRVDLICCRIEIGRELCALKKQVEQGNWETTLENLGYNTRQTQRLMQIAESAWADEIRTLGTDLEQRLPTDLQKLASLANLSLEQLQTLLSKHDLNELTREDVANEVGMLLKGVDVSEESRFSSSDATPGDEHREDHGLVEERDAVGIVSTDHEASATLVEESSVEENAPSQGMDHQQRIQIARRIVSVPRKKDKPAVIAVNNVSDRFQNEVRDLAYQYGKEAFNDAGGLAHCDEKTLAMVLLYQLKRVLDPDQAFAPEETDNPNPET